jgi:PHP family Zn ribbon phosphoesterase
VTKKRSLPTKQWSTIDLHIHTPASSDYQQKNITYLDILKQAETRGVDIIAFTDHNTVAGYRQMRDEIEQLEFLEGLNRLMPDERSKLEEYRRLREKILILPGIEFTATFGFHILGIFHPDKSVRDIEHLLIDLNIPRDQLDNGSATVGATSDVLTIYRRIAEEGGLVIAAHANSSNGVAMRGLPFGGQTKIAYTQDSNLHALEVTDLEQKGRRTTAGFFNGTKPEYPRRMHCIQGSDAHNMVSTQQRKKIMGVGDRSTEVLIPEVSFEALFDLFKSNDFARTQPHRLQQGQAYDFIQNARDEGANIVQDFHEGISIRGGKRYAIIADVCAFANTNGGTLYVGLNADPKKPVTGLNEPDRAKAELDKEISNRISPPLQCTLDVHTTDSNKVVRILVPRGEDPPYAVDDSKIYIRSEAETGLAVRDEIVDLVLRGSARQLARTPEPLEPGIIGDSPARHEKVEDDTEFSPKTGVEVVSTTDRGGTKSFTLRDLRNGNVVQNVTHKSARRLWLYAISQYDKLSPDLNHASITWQGNFGLLNRDKKDKRSRYDLIQRSPEGYHYYFGVTEDGIHGPWKELVGQDDE